MGHLQEQLRHAVAQNEHLMQQAHDQVNEMRVTESRIRDETEARINSWRNSHVTKEDHHAVRVRCEAAEHDKEVDFECRHDCI